MAALGAASVKLLAKPSLEKPNRWQAMIFRAYRSSRHSMEFEIEGVVNNRELGEGRATAGPLCFEEYDDGVS